MSGPEFCMLGVAGIGFGLAWRRSHADSAKLGLPPSPLLVTFIFRFENEKKM